MLGHGCADAWVVAESFEEFERAFGVREVGEWEETVEGVVGC